tara:strand:+ start:2775 stop:3806 length:1032 start_codon:yes stop_codon:yes gene_type:complete
MADYVTLVNRTLESLNEITLATNGTDFSSSRGIQSAVKTFVNQSINDIYNSELQWSFLHSDGTQATTAGTAEYSLPSDYRHVDYDTFIVTPTQLVSTNNFSSDANWTHTNSSISGGFLVLDENDSAQQTITSFINNRQYRATFRITGSTVTLKVGTSSGGTQIKSEDFTITNEGEGTVHTTTFGATASTLYITLTNTTSTQAKVDFINITEDIDPQRLQHITYEDFARNYRETDASIDSSSYGTPEYVYPTQDGKFGLHPIPDRGNYTVLFEYWTTHTELSAYDDTPTLATRYQDIVVSRAKYYAYMLRGDADMADRCMVQYQDGIKRMRLELINRDEVMRSV